MSLVRDLLNHWISRDGVPKMVFKKINFTCILILSIILYAGVKFCTEACFMKKNVYVFLGHDVLIAQV